MVPRLLLSTTNISECLPRISLKARLTSVIGFWRTTNSSSSSARTDWNILHQKHFLYDFVYRKHYFSVKEDETMLLSFDQYSHNVGSVEHLEEPGEANSSSAIIISLTICIDDLTQRLYICSSRLRSLDKLFYFEGKWQVQCTSGWNVGALYQESSLKLTAHCSCLLFFFSLFCKPFSSSGDFAFSWDFTSTSFQKSKVFS